MPMNASGASANPSRNGCEANDMTGLASFVFELELPATVGVEELLFVAGIRWGLASPVFHLGIHQS